MKKNEERANSMRSRVSAALDRVGLLPDDEDTKNIFINLVRSVLEKRSDVKNRYSSPVSLKVLENIALLKISFGFNNREVASVMCDDLSDIDRILKIRENEIAILTQAYTQAKSQFVHLKETLSSGNGFKEMDLRSQLALGQVAQDDNRTIPDIPLHVAKALEKVRWSDRFQDGDPDAICLAAEKYMAAGAIEVAEPLIEQVLLSDPDHSGGWFQKARMLLRKSALANRKAWSYHIRSEYADALSAEEQNFEMLALEEADSSEDFRQEAFDACVRAYSLLPDKAEYEKSAIQWSADYGTLRNLRRSVMMIIVREAGKSCSPYRAEFSLRQRIDARLGRLKKMIWNEARNTRDSILDADEMKRLAAQPLFSETTDKIIVTAYKELMKCGLSYFDKNYIRLSALNFIRLLVPESDYEQEVTDFVENLKTGIASMSGKYFGPFDMDNDRSRLLLHEHLDAIMTRSKQRDLVRFVYEKWCGEVEQRRDKALFSIYDDEIRLRFVAEDPIGAHQTACMGEKDGVFRRNDGYGALVLLRTAQHAELNLSEDASPAVTSHLEDKSMKSIAESYYDEQVQYLYSDDLFSFPEYLYEIS